MKDKELSEKSRINFKLARVVGRENLFQRQKKDFSLVLRFVEDDVVTIPMLVGGGADREREREKRDNVTSLIKILWSTALSKKTFFCLSLSFLSEGFHYFLFSISKVVEH